MTTNNSLTFQNDHLKVSLRKEPGCKIFLEVEVSAKASEASRRKAIELTRKDISIPGFRKGKAPEAMIVQNYEKYIEQEWKDQLLNTSFEEAIKLIQIPPFNRNSIKKASIKSASKDDGSKLSFEYEARPEIPSISPESLSIKIVPVKHISQKEIDESLEEYSLDKGEWKDVTDRPAQDGDFVIIDIDDIGEHPKTICTNSLFAVTEGKMGAWMRKLIIGMNSGETTEGMSEDEIESCKACEDGTPNHQHQPFVPTLCRITLHTIRQATPHALDDELAKKYGATSYSEFQERVKDRLKKNAEEERKDEERNLIEKELLTHYPFDIPESLIQGEIQTIKKSIIDNLRADGVEESKIREEAKKIETEIAQKYHRDFSLYFLTQKYAYEQNIEASKEEVSFELLRQMWLKQLNQNTINTNKDEKELLSEIQIQLVAVKALDHIIEKAKKVPEKA